MANNKKHVAMSEEAHAELSAFGNLGETYEQAVLRAVRTAKGCECEAGHETPAWAER